MRAVMAVPVYHNYAVNRPFNHNCAGWRWCTYMSAYYYLCFCAFKGKHGNYSYG
jgi:hypothetical protein